MPSSNRTSARSKPKTKTVTVEIDPAFNRGKRPSDEQIMARQDMAYRMKLLGKTPEEVAEIMGIAPRTARDYLMKAKERQVREIRTLEGKAGVLHQYQFLQYVMTEMIQAWEQSKKAKKSKTAGVETKDITVNGMTKPLGATETKKRTAQREEEQIGDAAYLDRAMKASERICVLLGLDAPAVQRLIVADDVVTKDKSYEELSTLPTEELLEMYRKTVGNSVNAR